MAEGGSELNSDALSKALKEMGWEKPFSELPVSSRALVDKIHKVEMELMQQKNKTKRMADYSQLLDKKISDTKEELRDTEALVRTKQKQVELEKHLGSLAERETGRLIQQCGQIETEIRSSEGRTDVLEKNLLKSSLELEDCRTQMAWDQQTMNNFLEESALKDEDIMAIMKYCEQDEKSIKSLTLAIEKKSLEAKEKRKALDKEITETSSTQLALDKTLEILLQTNKETKQMFHQMENTVKQKKNLDSELQKSGLQLAQSKQKVREMNTTITGQKHMMAALRDDNKESERKLHAQKKQESELELSLQKEKENLVKLQDELKKLKLLLDRKNSDVMSLMSKIATIKKDIKKNNDRLKEATAYRAALEQKLEALSKNAFTEAERPAQMEQILKETEKSIKDLDVQHKDLNKELLHSNQLFQLIKTKENDLLAHISRSKSAISSLQSQIMKQEKELNKQNETMYAQVEQKQNLEKKLCYLQGDVDAEEKRKFETKIAELTIEIEGKQQEAKSIKDARKRCEIAVQLMKREMERSEAKVKDLNDEVKSLTQLCAGMEKEVNALKRNKEDAIVKQDIKKLEVNRLRNRLYNEADNVLSEENRSLEVQKAVKERELEIKSHKEILNQELKIAEKERRKLNMEMNEKLSAIDKKKMRYEFLVASMGCPVEEGVDPQEYYITKAAKEKERVTQTRDALAAKVQHMELEIKSVQQVNRLFNSQTTECNNMLSELEKSNIKSSPEYQESLKLEEQLRATEERLASKKQQVESLKQEIQVMNNTLDSLLKEEQVEKDRARHKQALVAKLTKELNSQQEKLDRATKQGTKLTKQIRSNKNTKTVTTEEKDIKIKTLKECNRNIDKMLIKAMEDNPELRAVLESFFQQAGLTLPSPSSTPSSRKSFRISSLHGSPSSRCPVSSAASSSTESGRLSVIPNTVNMTLDLPTSPLPLKTKKQQKK